MKGQKKRLRFKLTKSKSIKITNSYSLNSQNGTLEISKWKI